MRTRLLSVLAILCVLVGAFGAVTGVAADTDAVLTVNTTSDTVDASPGNGSCSDSGGNCSLRAAIMEANALGGSNTINVPAGNYTLSRTGRGENAAATGDLDVTAGTLTITGAGQGTCGDAGATCINANQIDRVFHVLNSATLDVTGATITGGNPNDTYGGGIEVDGAGASLSLTNCLVTSNTTGPGTSGLNRYGGGIDIYRGTADITSSTISSNTAWEKGGGISNNSGSLTITKSTISGNQANAGAGIYNLASAGVPSTTITLSAITGNSTTGGSEFGGGIVNGGALDATNVTLSANTTNGSGAALIDDIGASHTNLSFVTLAGNTTSGSSGAANIYYAVFGPGNSLFSGNTGGNFSVAGSGSLSSQGYNLSDGTIPSATGTDVQSSATIGLSALADNGGPTKTMALGSASSAIDRIASGVNGCVAGTTTDQRSAMRANGAGHGGAACDIGAYEYDSSPLPLAVMLEVMQASATPAGAAIEWDTVDEADALGYFVERAGEGGDDWQRLNAQMIASQAPGSSMGYGYRWIDSTAQRGTTYRYRLVVVSPAGVETIMDTVSVQMQAAWLWLPVARR